MSGRRRGQPARSPRALVTVLVVTPAIVVSWIVGRALMPMTTPGDAASQAAAGRPSASRGDDAYVPPTPSTILANCVHQIRLGDAALSVARTTIRDWTAHVQAMADLESGRNTAAQTKAIWAKTRANGAHGVSAFRSADAKYQSVPTPCRSKPEPGARAIEVRVLGDCRHAEARVQAALGAARAAVADWAGHLKAMADRKAGHLDAHHAQLQWLALYKRAPANISKFRVAEDTHRKHRSCIPSG